MKDNVGSLEPNLSKQKEETKEHRISSLKTTASSMNSNISSAIDSQFVNSEILKETKNNNMTSTEHETVRLPKKEKNIVLKVLLKKETIIHLIILILITFIYLRS